MYLYIILFFLINYDYIIYFTLNLKIYFFIILENVFNSFIFTAIKREIK